LRKFRIVDQSTPRQFGQQLIHGPRWNPPSLQTLRKFATAAHPHGEEPVGNLDCPCGLARDDLRTCLLPQVPSSLSQRPEPPPAPPEV